jgi:DNA invertase Pin-like site-specific DNA recombinase
MKPICTSIVAAYLRVSTRGQDAATQRRAIERAARARGHRVARWFHEKESARSIRRPVLSEVRRAALRGEISTLYIFRLDRITRSGVADTFHVVEDLRRGGCTLVSVTDGVNFDGPWGDVAIAVFAAAAQIELAAMKERISAAREKIRASGGKWGRAPRLDETDYPRLLKLNKTKSVRQIAAALKVPRASVQRALARARAKCSA